MKLFIAGHGFSFENSPSFVTWLRKNKANFLVSFAHIDEGRLEMARKVREERRWKRLQKKSKGKK